MIPSWWTFPKSSNNSNHMIFSLILWWFQLVRLFVDNKLQMIIWHCLLELKYSRTVSAFRFRFGFVFFFKFTINLKKNIKTDFLFQKYDFPKRLSWTWFVKVMYIHISLHWFLLYLIFATESLKQHLVFTKNKSSLFSQIFLVCE